MKHNVTHIIEEIKNSMQVDEYLDLVDQNDCVVQTVARSYVYQNDLCKQMRSVWLFLKNKEGQFWIPHRSMTVKRLPGYLDGSVVGHVQAGETYEQAIIRETQEEVGISIDLSSIKYLGKLTPHEHGAFCFSAIYEMEIEYAPKNWSRDEIGDWYWMTPQQIIQRCSQDEKFKDTLPKIIAYFYL